MDRRSGSLLASAPSILFKIYEQSFYAYTRLLLNIRISFCSSRMIAFAAVPVEQCGAIG